MAVLTIHGNLIVDEAASLQTSITDNDTGLPAGVDNEVAWSVLLATMSSPLLSELNTLGIKPATGEESGDTTAQFPQVAERSIGMGSTDFIQLGTSTVTDLQFSNSTGGTITDGTATQIFATGDGAQIFLYTDSNSHILLGREGTTSDGGQTWTASSTGTVAFAIVLDETTDGTNVTGGNVWTIQYEALKHTNSSGVDDADTLDLSGLVDVKASFTTTTTANFGDFSHVPSGSDDWSAIEQTSTAGTDSSDPDMVITGLVPGSKVTVSTQGLGNNSQALNPGEAVRVDVVNHVNYPDFPLTNPDVHDLSKLSYSTHVGAVTEASFSLTQVNPGNTNTTVKVHIWAFNETSDLQGASLVSTASVGSGGLTGNDETLAPILGNTIKVYSDLAKTHLVTSGITITAAGDGSYFIDGLKTNYTVDFQVAESSHMDRFVVGNAQPTSGSGSNVTFDAGNFTFNISNTTSGTDHTGIGGNLLFEDDGPHAAVTLAATPTVTHDETPGVQTDNGANDQSGSLPAAFSPTGLIGWAQSAAAVVASSTPNYGADGAAASNPITYALTRSDGSTFTGQDSTLFATVTGAHLFLYTEGNLVVAREGSGSGGATPNAAGAVAFAIYLDPDTLKLDVAQYEAIKHTTSSSPDTSEGSSISNLIFVKQTLVDHDGDSSSATSSGAVTVTILDDGPTITAGPVALNLSNTGPISGSASFGYDVGTDGHNYAATSDFVDSNSGLTGVQLALSGTVGTGPNNTISNTSVTLTSETATSASFHFSFDYDTNPQLAGVQTATATGTLSFDKSADTYTVSLDNPIQGFSFDVLHTSELLAKNPTGNTGHPLIVVEELANNFFVQFTADVSPLSFSSTGEGTTNDTTFTGSAHDLAGGTETWVSATQGTNGVAGDTIQKDELLNLRFFQENILSDANPPGTEKTTPTASADGIAIKFDGIGSSEDLIMILNLIDDKGTASTTDDVTITRAIIVDNSDIIKKSTPGGVPAPYNTEFTLDNNDGLVIVESNDYNAPGEHYKIQGVSDHAVGERPDGKRDQPECGDRIKWWEQYHRKLPVVHLREHQ
ncbi:hypothetical protein ACVWY2_007625 [Bradyrhizobium sp. JR6.1]